MNKLSIIAATAASLYLCAPSALAQGGEQYIGEVKAFGFNFCPRGWLPAHGQTIKVSDNQALFSLYGTRFGGDGRTSFGLPDFRGRTLVHRGQGPGLSPRRVGDKYGSEITTQNIAHSHDFIVSETAPTLNSPTGATFGNFGQAAYGVKTETPSIALNSASISTEGVRSITNMMPTIALNYCVSTTGIYPPRN